MRSTVSRTTRNAGLAALVLTLSTGLAACSGSSDAEPAASGSESSGTNSGTDSGTQQSQTSGDGAGAGAQTFGEGCSAIPADGAGSFTGMATEPVATAASANPLLKTLVAAVTEAGLVDTLNSAEDITVFAPTDDAFAKIPAKDLKAVLADKETLTAILTHHVVPGQLSPEDVAGTHETLNKDKITVEGSGEDFTAEGAQVLCGNIPTANATVYVIDSVMMPKM